MIHNFKNDYIRKKYFFKWFIKNVNENGSNFENTPSVPQYKMFYPFATFTCTHMYVDMF